MTKQSERCPTCGAEVLVVGNVTKHYEPVKQSEVERLAKKIYEGVWLGFKWEDGTPKERWVELAQAILDEGYVRKSAVGLDVKLVTQELFEFEVSDSDLAEMDEKEIAYLLRYCEKRAKALAAAKDEIIKARNPQKEEPNETQRPKEA